MTTIPQVSWCIEVDNILECKSFTTLRALQRMIDMCRIKLEKIHACSKERNSLI